MIPTNNKVSPSPASEQSHAKAEARVSERDASRGYGYRSPPGGSCGLDVARAGVLHEDGDRREAVRQLHDQPYLQRHVSKQAAEIIFRESSCDNPDHFCASVGAVRAIPEMWRFLT